MSKERELLFAAAALRKGAIDADRFAQTCASWAADPSIPMADLLTKNGLIDGVMRAELERTIAEDMSGPRHSGVETQGETIGVSADGSTVHNLAEVDTVQPASTELGSVDQGPGRPTGHVVLSPLPGAGDSRDRYTLSHLHAKGGMGQVWLARDASLGREVALKELRPEQVGNQAGWARFLHEAKVTGQLEHPGIVPVYELAEGGHGLTPYYTMRFIRGTTLSEATRNYHDRRAAGEADSLGLRELLNCFVGVCNAISYAHSRGVIHRDLKGQNIVLGEFGEVMVLDWGLAKLAGHAGEETGLGPGPLETENLSGYEETQHGQVLGTPAYMAPEQALGQLEKLDARTDVYGLGAVLYEILTGRPPFVGASVKELLRKVREEEPDSPREFNPALPQALQAVCLRALAKRPEGRYSTAAELAQEVRRWLADEPVLAYREPLTRRAARWARRHRTAVVSGAALTLLGLVTLGITTALVTRERNEARVQREQSRRAVDEMYSEVAEKWLEDRIDPLQKTFLDKALAYYENFTSEEGREPSVVLERGRAYQRLGDIQKKLGRVDDAGSAYQRSIAVLTPLVGAPLSGVPSQRQLAITRERLATLLVDRGLYVEAEKIYQEALGGQEHAAKIADSTDEDRRLQAKTLKKIADLQRLTGHLDDAEASYRKALGLLEPPGAKFPPASLEIRQDLALTHDALGLLLGEMGRPKEAEASYRRILPMQETLVSASPTAPRFREALAKTSNSLALLLLDEGPTAEAEDYLRKEITHFERLSTDFPDRPEYRRTLARGLVNLGILLQTRGNLTDAEKVYARAIELNDELAKAGPSVLQFRLDLAKCCHNLGQLLLDAGRLVDSEPLLLRALSLLEPLAAEHADAPRHRQALARTLDSLAELQQAKSSPEVEATYQRAVDLHQRLVSEFQGNQEYGRDLARCLGNFGTVLASAGNVKEAEARYRRALAILKGLGADRLSPREVREEQARALNNLADLHLSDSEPTFLQAITLLEALSGEPAAPHSSRVELASVLNNYAELLDSSGRIAEAEKYYSRSVDTFEALLANAPKSARDQNVFAYVLEKLGLLRLKDGRAEEAKIVLLKAVQEEREAIAADGSLKTYREMLHQRLLSLAKAQMAVGDDAAAAEIAAEVSRVATDRAIGSLDAARVLAGCLNLVSAKGGLEAARKEELARMYSNRSVVWLREAIENDPKMAQRIATDSAFAGLRSRNEFEILMGGYAAAAGAKTK